MTSLKYITKHPEINIGLQYIRNTSEYILELHIHKHSILTMKVFSRHNFQHKSSCLYHLGHRQVLVIFNRIWITIIGSGSSLDMDHHHWIWIITRSGSPSLDLDHHWIWSTITGSGSSLDMDHH